MVAAASVHCEQTLMFADIVGYSRLMERNETLAVEMLGEYRQILLSYVDQHGGHLVEFTGDAMFARFDTASSAVAAAIAIQQHLLAVNEVRDKKLPRLQTRIGLHKGEVMLRDSAVFGDSVNIAARLESLAVADGICLSRVVYEDVRLSLSSPAKRLGVQSLKNIQQKVYAYLIKPAGIGWRDHLHYGWRNLARRLLRYRYPLIVGLFALIGAAIYFLPRWLVPGYAANYIEVADFKNLMTETAEADYFSAGITEAVRSQLADLRGVYIVDVKDGINAPLRLEGSVQKLGDHLRIAYRLFRRKGNVQIAGGKLDGAYQDIFILQDRLVGEISRFLASEFDLENFRPAPLRLTGDVTAYDYYLQGLQYLSKPASHETIDAAIQYFSTALIHDTKFSLANSGICEAYRLKYELVKTAQWLNEAEQYCLLALAQDDRSIKAYKAIGRIYVETGQYTKAIGYLERARLIDPNDVASAVDLAGVYRELGNKEYAEKLLLATIETFPKSWVAYDGYGYFLFRSGRYDEAIANYKKTLEITPDNISAINNIAAMSLLKNDFQQATYYLEKAAQIAPDSAVYANTGSMHYLAGNFRKAITMYERALRLEPNNYQWMTYIADTYKYLPDGEEMTEFYFESAIQAAREDIALNPRIAKSYRYLAIALSYFGRLAEANEALLTADNLDANSIEALSSHLRIAIAEDNEARIRIYVKKLLEAQYSDTLLRANPDFAVLNDKKFRDLFAQQH